jgi:hypothetical protein
VRVNANLKTETVEELIEKKKRMHLSAARLLADEVKADLEQLSNSLESKQRYQQDQTGCEDGFTLETLFRTICEQCEVVLMRHSSSSLSDYIDDNVFRSMVTEILNMKTWAHEKWKLWLRSTSEYIRFVQRYSLLESHRFWLGYLQKCIYGSQPQSIERKQACLELLQSKGLVRHNIRGERNADGEDVIIIAGGDGWSADDIDALLEAGADVNASDCNGQTSVWNAASCGNAHTLRALLEGGGFADTCVNDNERNVELAQAGASALWIAACNGHLNCVDVLVEAKADLNKDSQNMTPIGMACQNGYVSCVQALIAAKASLLACNECVVFTRSFAFIYLIKSLTFI